MKTLCAAGIGMVAATTVAFAADLPSRRAPPVYVAPVVTGYSWTGVEFGLTSSYAFPNGQRTNTVAFGGAAAQPNVSLNKSGTDDVGGGIGFNYQFTRGTGIVVGGMVDVDYFNLHATADIASPPGQANYQERLGYLGTANGRLGYAFDRFLVYGTGGFAFAGLHTSANFFSPQYLGTTNSTKTGYDVGGGIEYAIPTDSILNYLSVEKILGIDKKLGLDIFDGTVRAEYIHYDLGTQGVAVNPVANGAGGYVSTFRTQGNLVRVGLGYKFGGLPDAPVVARY